LQRGLVKIAALSYYSTVSVVSSFRGSNDAVFWRRGCGSGLRCAAFIAALCVLVGCGEPAAQNGRGPGGPGAGGAQTVGVITAPATTEAWGLEVEAIGTAGANESVEITSKSSNVVTAIHFTEGQPVRGGALLVTFDDAQEQADLAVAEAALAESQSQFGRSRDLFSTQALSRQQLEQIEATHKANQARVIAAKARLADTVIRAPFSGRTGFRRISLGSLVNPGTVITTLDDDSLIKLDFTVPQTYLYAMKTGLPVAAQTIGLPNRTFQGRLTTLDSRVDPVARSITARAELPNKDGVLRPGMFMTVKLTGEPAPTLRIPEEALVPEQGKLYVFAVTNGVVARREVSIGRRRPGEVEVTAGLRENERVIIEGTQKVREGSKVHEMNAVESKREVVSS
jgi:membrane fusion protein, multidrug efflux system